MCVYCSALYELHPQCALPWWKFNCHKHKAREADEGQRDSIMWRNLDCSTIAKGVPRPGCHKGYQQRISLAQSRCWKSLWEVLSPNVLADRARCRDIIKMYVRMSAVAGVRLWAEGLCVWNGSSWRYQYIHIYIILGLDVQVHVHLGNTNPKSVHLCLIH